MNLEHKLKLMHELVDPTLQLVVSDKWSSLQPEYRALIRRHLGDNFAPHFTREQWAQLYDLNWLPEANKGSFSISHNQSVGGFSYSNMKHGFDVEVKKRISTAILKRTSNDIEYMNAPVPEFLWVAKEAAFKALHAAENNLILTDLVCLDWQPHFNNQIYSFKMQSAKQLGFKDNRGFVFSENEILFCVYYR